MLGCASLPGNDLQRLALPAADHFRPPDDAAVAGLDCLVAPERGWCCAIGVGIAEVVATGNPGCLLQIAATARAQLGLDHTPSEGTTLA